MDNTLLQIVAAESHNESPKFVLTYMSQSKRTQAKVTIPPLLLPEDRESIRWYLEEYRKFPFEPASAIARRTIERIRNLGEKLFRYLFNSGHDAQKLWELV